jgi:hypothetical protein
MLLKQREDAKVAAAKTKDEQAVALAAAAARDVQRKEDAHAAAERDKFGTVFKSARARVYALISLLSSPLPRACVCVFTTLLPFPLANHKDMFYLVFDLASSTVCPL